MKHKPVLTRECLQFFEDISLKIFFEGTVGNGGHAQEILKAHPEIERYLGCDLDPTALDLAKKILQPWEEKVELMQGNFADLDTFLQEREIQEVNGFFLIWGYHLCNLMKQKGVLAFLKKLPLT